MGMTDPGHERLKVEVAVAWPEVQVLIALELPAGATLADAIEAAAIGQKYPELELHPDRLGVFGERKKPSDPLHDGDRVEIYRPLKVDPKEARRLTAEARKNARTSA